MSFKLTQRHIDQFYADGYTVFENLVPPSLLQELRTAGDVARETARRNHGPNAQRLEPMTQHVSDARPFRDYGELPGGAIQTLLSPRHTFGFTDLLGVLFEPAQSPWCTNWHRDTHDDLPPQLREIWSATITDVDYHNQVNCPLYEDTCTWIVPGSHLRMNTPAEVAAFESIPAPTPDLQGLSAAAAERACLDYCRRMPGAVRLVLDAGDFAVYRNCMWHLGNYTTYKKRATLHDGIDTPRWQAFRKVLDEKHRALAATATTIR